MESCNILNIYVKLSQPYENTVKKKLYSIGAMQKEDERVHVADKTSERKTKKTTRMKRDGVNKKESHGEA